MIGKTLAHYQITGLLGKGGMGEVYRALDTKLDRDVAIKLLPIEFSRDPERVARFQREATTLAKLQHTNIASIYGFEQDHDQRFLVMELVEGEELAERLQRGPLPVEETIDIALQVAEGLEVAHAQGIVHRDLKPANIKITPTRDAKILDFGLARAYSGETMSDSATQIENSPTITAAMTQAGMILGTAAYMSPEQARGRSIDRQSDIWSFGVMLFEMLTGDRLFGGETISDSIGAILHRDPDLERLPAVPPPLRTLLQRCLQRDKRQRLRDIGDARLELEAAKSGQTTPELGTTSARGRIGWIAAAAMAVLALALGWMKVADRPEPRHPVTTLGLSKNAPMYYGWGGAWPHFSISADGQRVVHVGGTASAIYLHEVGSFEATRVADTAGASLPVLSPDGRWIAYFAQSRLWKIAVSGGAPIELCQTPNGPGLAWGEEHLYYARTNGGGLWRVPTAGGEPQPISTLDGDRDETSHRWPDVLPGERHLLVTIKTAKITTFDDAEIGLLSLDSGELSILVRGGSHARYVSTGHLVYGRNSQLFAVGFDTATMTVEGTPTPVLEDVFTAEVNGSAHYALSAEGSLAYVPASETHREPELVWLDISGKTRKLELSEPRSSGFSFSGDGERLAAMVPAANDKIWVFDLERGTASRLTNTPGNDGVPCFSPDGTLIAYSNDRSGREDLYLIRADGSAPARKLLESEYEDYATDWSPDGSQLLFDRVQTDGTRDIWVMTMAEEHEAMPWLQSPHDEYAARFSPDGNWVAYVSSSSSDRDVYVRPFPGPGNAIRVSTAGGVRPCWSPDGNTLYYRTGDHIMGVPLHRNAGLEMGEPSEILDLDEDTYGRLPLAPDGERFLASRLNLEQTAQYQIRVIFDWTARLRELEPGS